MSNSNDNFSQLGAGSQIVDSSDYQRLASRRSRSRARPSVENELFRNGHEFDFFQAVSILELIYPDRQRVGQTGSRIQSVRFAAHSSSSSFAASPIYEISPATTKTPVARMTVGFIGLTGPSGVLPQHYTELLQRIEFEARGPQKYALRDWFDLFNDRLIALFYRSWKKYRPYATYNDALKGKPDCFTHVLQSVAGFGMPSLTAQVHKFVPRLCQSPALETNPQASDNSSENPQLSDPVNNGYSKPNTDSNHDVVEAYRAPIELALLRYSALFAQRPRCASNLQSILNDYFGLPITVQEFHGNWLSLDETAQTRLGVAGGNSVLGINSVVGDQTWERQNKILICVGPLENHQFARMMPNYQSKYEFNDYSLLTELVRLFAGPEIEFDIQMSIRADSIPEATLSNEENSGIRLGWNSWLSGDHPREVVSDTLLCAA